jgi:hypothetical protein
MEAHAWNSAEAEQLYRQQEGPSLTDVSEEERHAIAHARNQVEQASAEKPECCFDSDLVKDLLRVIDRRSPAEKSTQETVVELMEEIGRLRAKLSMAEGTLALQGIGIDTHATNVAIMKSTMAKLIETEKQRDLLAVQVEQLTALQKCECDTEESCRALAEAWAQRDVAVAQVKRAAKALQPFASCVYNDNGNVTITTSNLRIEDYVRARTVLKKRV